MIDSFTIRQNNHYWSQNIGSVHFIGFNAEFYFYPQFGTHQIQYQYEWLEQDLKEATKQENRKQRPWIIAMSHRPFYCVVPRNGRYCYNDCYKLKNTPQYLNSSYNIETLLQKYGVDVYFSGHDHLYRRFWPIFNGTYIDNKLKANPYDNPEYLVQIISGVGGSHTMSDCTDEEIPGTAFVNSVDRGYMRIEPLNMTHLQLAQISDTNGMVIDQVIIVKNRHFEEPKALRSEDKWEKRNVVLLTIALLLLVVGFCVMYLTDKWWSRRRRQVILQGKYSDYSDI